MLPILLVITINERLGFQTLTFLHDKRYSLVIKIGDTWKSVHSTFLPAKQWTDCLTMVNKVSH
jgi:hypothetical protein